MRRQSFTIPYRLDGLNAVTNNNRTHWAIGAKRKKEEQELIMWAIKQAKIKPVITYPVHIHLDWVEKNKRRDPDNIISAKKTVLDALVVSGILRNDGWQEIESISDEWRLLDDHRKTDGYVNVLIIEEE